MAIVVAVLVPPIQQTNHKPNRYPIANALSHLFKSNILTVFGFEFYHKNNTVWINGKYCYNNLFKDISSPINIIHDRFPSQIRKDHFLAIQDTISNIPLGNPYSTTLLCRDKLACQRLLENGGIIMPEVSDDPACFTQLLNIWKQGFIKPQFGALGQGVQAVTPGMHLPQRIQGLVPNQSEPSILQRGIYPPKDWAGMSVRQLMQKDIGGSWIPRTAVLRRSKQDAVVNVSRGAEAIPAIQALPSDTIDYILQQSQSICSILDAQPNGIYNVEFGLDFVIDGEYRPWLIEVNSRPRGRLEQLAQQFPDRYLQEHEAACIQPIRYLASLC